MVYKKRQIKDDAVGQLETGITAGQTSITLKSGHGALFPATSGDGFIATLVQFDGEGNVIKKEKIQVTARSGDVLTTVVRGYDGTTAYSFDADDYIYLFVTEYVVKDIQDEVTRLGTDKLDKDGELRTGLETDSILWTDGSGNETELAFDRITDLGKTPIVRAGGLVLEAPSVNVSGLGDATSPVAGNKLLIEQSGVNKKLEALASDTSAGLVEKLTNTEALAFTDTDRYATAYQLLLSQREQARAKFMFNFFTDFINAPTSTGGSNDIVSAISGGASATIITAGASNKPGVALLDVGSSNGLVTIGSNANIVQFSGGVWTFEALINITNLSVSANRAQHLFGFLDDFSAVNQTDGIFFLYDLYGVTTGSASSANWQIVTANNSTRTFTTTSTAVAGGSWVKLKIVVNAGGTSAEFFVNDVSVGTITTNIPTSSGRECGFGIMNKKSTSSGTTGRTSAIDYLAVDCLFTTPR